MPKPFTCHATVDGDWSTDGLRPMGNESQSAPTHEPLAYHRLIVEHLCENEPEIRAWGSTVIKSFETAEPGNRDAAKAPDSAMRRVDYGIPTTCVPPPATWNR